MHHITCYLDFASPEAWLAFVQLPQTLEGLSCHVAYRPVQLAALHPPHGPSAPASQPLSPSGEALAFPAHYPFATEPLLHLALQCSPAEGRAQGAVNRLVAETLLRHVWQGGQDALEPQRLQTLEAALAGQQRTSAEQAQTLLRGNTEAAAARGVCSLPTCEADGQLFCGLDSLPRLRACLKP